MINKRKIPRGGLKRYFAIMLTVVTFITSNPYCKLVISNLTNAYSYSFSIVIDLDNKILKISFAKM